MTPVLYRFRSATLGARQWAVTWSTRSGSCILAKDFRTKREARKFAAAVRLRSWRN